MKAAPQIFTVETLAEYLQVSAGTIQNITRPKNCLIAYTKVGKQKRFTEKAVNEYLERFSNKSIAA